MLFFNLFSTFFNLLRKGWTKTLRVRTLAFSTVFQPFEKRLDQKTTFLENVGPKLYLCIRLLFLTF